MLGDSVYWEKFSREEIKIRRLTFEYVKTEFEKRGYELLESEYKNVRTKMRYRCPEHPDKLTKITYNDLRNGAGCMYCGIESRDAIRRTPIEVVEKAFSDRGYILLDRDYKNGHTPLRFVCPKHPDKQTKISYTSIRQGSGCQYCANTGKPSLSDIKQEFHERGYELLSKEYINSTTKLKYKCRKHPNEVNEITYGNFKHLKQGCPHCAGTIKYTIEQARELFAREGYKLLDSEYANNHKPMAFECPSHPDKDTKLSLKELQRGTRCRYCYLDRNKGETHINYNPNLTDEERMYRRRHSDYIDWRRKVFEKDNYTCVKCGDSTGGNLNAHHKDGFNWCKERRMDVTNGETLCETCHKDFHDIYGYGGNTEEQFNEWMAIT